MGLLVSAEITGCGVLFTALGARVLGLVLNHFRRGGLPLRSTVADEKRFIGVRNGCRRIRALHRLITLVVHQIRHVIVILVLSAIGECTVTRHAAAAAAAQAMVVFRYNYRGYRVKLVFLLVHKNVLLLLLGVKWRRLLLLLLLVLMQWRKECGGRAQVENGVGRVQVFFGGNANFIATKTRAGGGHQRNGRRWRRGWSG